MFTHWLEIKVDTAVKLPESEKLKDISAVLHNWSVSGLKHSSLSKRRKIIIYSVYRDVTLKNKSNWK